MTHKGWRVVKPQHNQSIGWTDSDFKISRALANIQEDFFKNKYMF